MKRKRQATEESEEKDPKKPELDACLFIHAFANPAKELLIMVYNLRTKLLEHRSVIFSNWFYFYRKLFPMDEILNEETEKSLFIHVTKIPNATVYQNNPKELKDVYKITYDENKKSEIFAYFQSKGGELYEMDIPRNIRFVTYNRIRFLEVLQIELSGEYKVLSQIKFHIPVYCSIQNQKFRKLVIDELYDLSPEHEEDAIRNVPISEIKGNLVCLWDKYDRDLSTLSLQQNCIIYLHDMIKNFHRLGKDLHRDRIPIDPYIYYILQKPIPLCDKTDLANKEQYMLYDMILHMRQVITLTQRFPILLCSVLQTSNRKMYTDYMYMSCAPLCKTTYIIYGPRENLETYTSDRYLEVFTEENLVIADRSKNEVILSLDYVSMYPSIMLMLFENDPLMHPYFEGIATLLSLKLSERNKYKMVAYKILLNSIYGSLGTSNKDKQYLLPGNINIAKRICREGRILLEKTIKYFGNVLYCNTDSLIVKGPEDELEKKIKQWNKQDKPEEYKYTELKIEHRGEKVLFINKVDQIWLSTYGFIHTIGWLFNSVKMPKIISDIFLEDCLLMCMKTAINGSHFVELIENYQLKKKRTLTKLYDLVSVNKMNKANQEKKVAFRLASYNLNEMQRTKGLLDYKIILYSADKNLATSLEVDYMIAEKLLFGRMNNRNFRIKMIFTSYLKSFINKLKRI